MSQAQREALARIERSQRHLLRLANDVLNLARVETGRVDYTIVDYTIEDVALQEIVLDLLPMFEPQVMAKSRHHDRPRSRARDAPRSPRGEHRRAPLHLPPDGSARRHLTRRAHAVVDAPLR